LISVVLLYFALGQQELGLVWETLKTARYWWILPGIAVYFIGVWVRSWRWHYLLRPVRMFPPGPCSPWFALGISATISTLPGQEKCCGQWCSNGVRGYRISASLATVIVERVFDGVVMLGFVFLNLPEVTRLKDSSGFLGSIQSLAIWGAVIFIGVLAVFILAAMFPHRTENVIHAVGDKLLPEKWRERVYAVASRFLTGLESLRSPKDVLMVFFTSVLIWLFETGKYWFVMHAFNFEVSFFALMLMNGIVNLATTIPSAPGYIGTFDAPGIAVLSAYGVPREIATGYTLVLHAALWLPITLLGAYYFTREGIKWDKALQEARSEPSTTPSTN